MKFLKFKTNRYLVCRTLVFLGLSAAASAAVHVTISPTSTTVSANRTWQFIATVSGASNPSVSWSVNGIAGGNSVVGAIASNGLYTAPAVVPSPNTVTVRATSVQNPDKSASAKAIITGSTGTTPPTITTSGLPDGTAGTAYSATLSATGGTSPYTWSVVSGQLAPGLTLSSQGAISGTPSSSGQFSFSAQARDSAASANCRGKST